MKRITAVSLLLALCSPIAAWAGEAQWQTDVDAALKQAKTENKVVLLDFTGSDWCIWCKKLDAEVFSQPEFKEYAADNLVLVKVDFPQAKPQTEEQKRINAALAQKYSIEGFPTIVVLNPAGEQIGTLGYSAGGPRPWLNRLQAISKS